jgi:hypothetical protein
MTHYNNKPVFYIIGSDGWQFTVKYGTTRHVAYRKNPYATANPRPVYYKIVFVLDDTVLTQRGLNLYLLDSIYFPRWLEQRGLGNLKCNLGGGTEFYIYNSPATEPAILAREFLAYMKIPIIEEITDDSLFPLYAGTDLLETHEKCKEKECNCDMDFGVHRFSCPCFGDEVGCDNVICDDDISILHAKMQMSATALGVEDYERAVQKREALEANEPISQ